MKRCIFILIFLILLFGNVLAGKGLKKGGLYFEFYYGQSFIDPADLNLYSSYNNEYYNYYYDYYGNNYNNAYSVAISNGIDGEFKDLKKNTLFGGRLKYYFPSSKWAVSLGLKYLYGSSDSNVGFEYNIDSFYSGEYTLSRRTDPFRLYVESYAPHIGIHYTLFGNNAINLETFVSAGIVFASCGSFEQYYYNKTEASGFVDEIEIIQDYDGTGVGLSIETGLKLKINLIKSLSLFFEGGYSYQRINKISGEAFYKRNDKDNYSDGYFTQYNWEGDWVINTYSLGDKHTINHSELNQNSVTDFNLDLSGFYLKVGLSLKIF